MGSVCSFVPQQPWLVLIISKSGQLVLQDIRLLGQALLAQQLQGPVYDMAWSIQQQQQGRLSGQADAAAAEGFSAAGAAAGGHAELQLCVVGRDSCIRSYAFGREALLAGEEYAQIAAWQLAAWRTCHPACLCQSGRLYSCRRSAICFTAARALH
jgi:hypothetical protein